MLFQQCSARVPAALLWLAGLGFLSAADQRDEPAFLGAQSCASSSCHGGAATNRSEFTLWSKYDFHHSRPVATLTTARSARMAEALEITDPSRDPRCTACHAPLQTVSPKNLAPEVRVTEGVSCENCHAPSASWLRSHSRTDWTTPDRVAAGMRDLKSLYVRANTCVACHQNVEPALRRAGHPELLFEMDGQSATEPRHWPKAVDKPGAQCWLVGQAVALREMTWQLGREAAPEPNLRDRCEGLLWVLQCVVGVAALPGAAPERSAPSVANPEAIHRWSDEVARLSAQSAWAGDLSRRCLAALSATSADFKKGDVSAAVHARRAERLVLALDRMIADVNGLSGKPGVSPALNRLFELVQSVPDFDPVPFAAALQEFHSRLSDASK